MTKNFVGISLILIVGAIYIFYKGKTPNRQVMAIYGVLADRPDYGVSGGDFKYEFVTIRLKGNTRRYFLRNCAYSSADLRRLDALNIGDSLRIGVDGDTLKERLAVVSLYSMEHGVILGQVNLDNCNAQEWKMLFYLALIILAVILFKTCDCEIVVSVLSALRHYRYQNDHPESVQAELAGDVKANTLVWVWHIRFWYLLRNIYGHETTAFAFEFSCFTLHREL